MVANIHRKNLTGLFSLAVLCGSVVDAKGEDATFSVSTNAITIFSNIYIHGKAANPEAAKAIEDGILEYWAHTRSGEKWKYVDPESNVEYAVEFNVSVSLYKQESGIEPWVIPEALNPFNRDNFIEVVPPTPGLSSTVRGSDEGRWVYPAYSYTMYAHEFGHLLGFRDRYTIGGWPVVNIPDPGWKGNIMSASNKSHVEQRNIDVLAKRILRQARDNTSHKGEIDPSGSID